MSFTWPEGFPRVPDEDWVHEPLGTLAMKYDSVEEHGWYDNLDPSVERLAEALDDGHILLDYSGGTGILPDRLLQRIGDRDVGILIVDSSPKFLRLALEKLGSDPRMAFRLIRYIKPERRLQLIEEIVEAPLLARGVDALVSTNAIHLYYDLSDTLASWKRSLKPGGLVHVQSGNILNPNAPEGTWIIDETVEHLHARALHIVRTDEAWAKYRPALDDTERMAKYDALRKKYFLPVRPLEHYVDALNDAGLRVREVACRPIEARNDDWLGFLAAYHEGVLGWIGGVAKIDGTPADDGAVNDRLALMKFALNDVLGPRGTFKAAWTYVMAERAHASDV